MTEKEYKQKYESIFVRAYGHSTDFDVDENGIYIRLDVRQSYLDFKYRLATNEEPL